MTGRNLPAVMGMIGLIGLSIGVGCSEGGARDVAIGVSTDAGSISSQAAGSPDARSTDPSPGVADADQPPVDGAIDGMILGGGGGRAGADGVGDARQETDASSAGDAPGGRAVDASDAATGVGVGDATDRDAADDAAAVNPETGRLAGITAAHNAVRALVQTQPPLPLLVWNQTIADYAQQWATTLATSMCADPQHRTGAELEAKDYGENLATFEASGTLRGGTVSTAADAVTVWASEKACWTFGTIQGTEKCDKACYTNLNSDGCGHYTQVVWRGSTELGCGVATCKNGVLTEDIWICNYAPAGNFIGRAPY
jgi:pathogenesis-related protein 1